MINRVAFVGDLHMNTRWATRAIDYAGDQGAQVIVQLGDFGYTFDRKFLDGIESALERHYMRLLFVDGNHEDFPHLYGYPTDESGLRPLRDRIAHLPRGHRWEWGGVHFLAMGGAHSVDRKLRVPGRSWWPEETITLRQVAEAAEPGVVDVLISHDSPAGVVIPGIDDRETLPSWLDPVEVVQSQAHRELLRELTNQVRPTAIWHGHYHVQYQSVADLGYGPVKVTGLDCDETSLDANVSVVDVADLLLP